MKKRLTQTFTALFFVAVVFTLPKETTAQTVIRTWNCGSPNLADVVATLTDDGTLTISGTGAMANYSSFTAPWSTPRAFITVVIIEDGVTTIGSYAFWGCTGLTSVTIPNSVTRIRNSAFSGCTGLTSVTIPNSVTTIGSEAFYECTGLRTISILNPTPPTIQSNTFDNIHRNASRLNVPQSSVNLYGGADFWKEFVFINTSPRFEWDCGMIPETVSAVLDEEWTLTISGTGAMANFVIADGYSPWFNIRTFITSVVIEDGVTTIGRMAFNGCTGLTSVTIPNSVTTIGDMAFYGCSGLTSVTIGNSVTTIESHVFLYCSNLTSINVEPNNANFSSENGVLFNKDKTILLQYPRGKQGAYTIPNSVTTIGSHAFTLCTLTSVTIPNSVTMIESGAFYNCTSLRAIIILNPRPPIIDSETFRYISTNACLYVPQNSIGSYNSLNLWRNIFSCIRSLTHLASLSVSSGTLSPVFNPNTTAYSLTVPNNVSLLTITAAPAYTEASVTGTGEKALNVGSNTFDIVVTEPESPSVRRTYTLTVIRQMVVTFDSQGGSAVNSQFVSDKVTRPVNPTQPNYTFGGWYKESACITPWDFDIEVATANTTLYAKWMLNTYAVTFVDGLGNEIIVRTVEHGKNATLPANPLRETHNFTGWSGDYTNVTSNRTITAQWTIKTYTVAFVDGLGNEIVVRTVDHGTNATLPANPLRETHNFTGWSGDYTNVTSSRTITAQWTLNTYSVTWNVNGGTPAPTQTSINHGSSITAPAAMTKTGYAFGGWYNNEALTTAVTFPISNVTASQTLYAKWTFVPVPVTNVTASFPSIVGTGQQIELSGTVEPQSANQTILWSVFTASPTGAVIIDGNTLFTVTEGTAFIRATVENGANNGTASYTQNFFITVSETQSIASNERVIPSINSESGMTASINQLPNEFTAGPNPVNKQSGDINFFWQGNRIDKSALTVYDAFGNIINKVKITENILNSHSVYRGGSQSRRIVGSWDLTDSKGRLVSEGTYLVRGIVITSDGKRERVSVLVGVR